MIVQCDQCSQRYRIREDQLPESGGKIRCTNCDNVFVVRPSDEAEAEPAKQEDNRSWKLRLSGLTYEFHTLESLQGWLVSRELLKDVKLARDGEPWKELGDYPEVMTDQIRTKFFPTGDIPKSSDVKEEKSEPAASEPSSASEPEDEGLALSGYHNSPAPPSSRSKPAGKSPGGRSSGGGGGSRRPPSSSSSRRRRPTPVTEPGLMTASVGRGFLFAFILSVVIAIGLHFAGVIDLGAVIPGFQEPRDEVAELRKKNASKDPNAGNPTTTPPKKGGEPETAAPVGPKVNLGEAPVKDDTARQLKGMLDTVRKEGYKAVEQGLVFTEEEIVKELEAADEEAQALLNELSAEVTKAREAAATAKLELFQKQLADIDKIIGEEKYTEAQYLLERLEPKWPDSIELHERLLTVYTKLKKRSLAKERKKKLKGLKAQTEAP